MKVKDIPPVVNIYIYIYPISPESLDTEGSNKILI